MSLPVVESRVSLRPYNSFGLPALAERLVRIADESGLYAVGVIPFFRKSFRARCRGIRRAGNREYYKQKRSKIFIHMQL